MVKFLVQSPNLELRLQIDLLVMRCSKMILCSLAILTGLLPASPARRGEDEVASLFPHHPSLKKDSQDCQGYE